MNKLTRTDKWMTFANALAVIVMCGVFLTLINLIPGNDIASILILTIASLFIIVFIVGVIIEISDILFKKNNKGDAK